MNVKRKTQLKLLGLLCFTTVTIGIHNLFVLVAISIFVVLLFGLYASWKDLVQRIRFFAIVAIGVLLAQVLFNTTIPVFDRLLIGFAAVVKITTLSLIVFLFTQTTSPSNLIAAVLFLPQKIQLMLTITFSLIPVIQNEAARIVHAQKTRGLKNKVSILAAVALIVPLLHRVLKRAEQLSCVLYARGYHDGIS